MKVSSIIEDVCTNLGTIRIAKVLEHNTKNPKPILLNGDGRDYRYRPKQEIKLRRGKSQAHIYFFIYLRPIRPTFK